MSDSQGLNAARARALELSARLLVREIDAQALTALLDPALLDALDAYDSECAGYVSSLAGEGHAGLERLATEFCALFVVSRETCPYASAWLPGAPADVGAALTRKVDHWMEQLGVEVAPGEWGNIPRDHIAVLTGLVALALLSEMPAGEALARTIAAETLSWVPKFADAVAAASTSPLYRAAARLLEHALSELRV